MEITKEDKRSVIDHCYLTYFISGMVILIFGVILPNLIEERNLSFTAAGGLLSFLAIGNLCSSLVYPIFCGMMSQKTAVVVLAIPYPVCLFLFTLGLPVPVLYVMIFLIGITKGMITIIECMGRHAGWLTAALLCRVRGIPEPLPAPPAAAQTEPPPALDTILAQAAVTYLKLCGFVLYFRLLAAGCGLLLPAVFAPFPAMLLEVCSGCDYAARTGLWASGLCCAALSVQGASVLLQVRTLCPPEVSLRSLLWGRLLHLPLSLALFYLGLPQSAVESFNTLCARVVPMRRVPTDCALLVFAVCCITACEACRLTEKRHKTQLRQTKTALRLANRRKMW